MNVEKRKLTIKHYVYFQVRESPAAFNIPTPTPAPDRGGPIACLSGPVASAPGRAGPVDPVLAPYDLR